MPTKTKPKTKAKPKTQAQRAPRPQSQSIAPPAAEPISEKNRRAIALLDSWDNPTPEEIAEQKETWAFLKKVLDEDRLSPNRLLFPDEGEE